MIFSGSITHTASAVRQLCVGLVLIFLLNACDHNKTNSTSTAPLQVTIAHSIRVSGQDIPMHYTTSGTVTSDHRVSISTRLSGYIREMHVREGDRVKMGQVLLHIDPINIKQALVQAKADLNNAKAEMLRYTSLLHEGAVTQQQFDTIKLRYHVAQSQVKQARHQLSYTKITSPVNGVIVEKRMAQGDLASPGMPILTLEDPSSLLVKTYVSEQFIGQIHVGDDVDVEIASLKQHFKGMVRQVVQAADPVSHQFMVKVSLPSEADIHPGMYAQTGFQIGTRKALLLPEAAVLLRAGLHAVYIMDDASILHYRLIRTGQTFQGTVEVLSGLHDGDHVVWGGSSELQTGMLVQQ